MCDFPTTPYSQRQPRNAFGTLLTKFFVENEDNVSSSKQVLPLLVSSSKFLSALSPHVLIDTRVPIKMFHFLCENAPTTKYAHTIHLDYEFDFDSDEDDDDEESEDEEEHDEHEEDSKPNTNNKNDTVTINQTPMSSHILSFVNLRAIIIDYSGFCPSSSSLFIKDLKQSFKILQQNPAYSNTIESFRFNSCNGSLCAPLITSLIPQTLHKLRELQFERTDIPLQSGASLQSLLQVNGRTLQYLNLNEVRGLVGHVIFNLLAEHCPVLVSLAMSACDVRQANSREVESSRKALLNFIDSPCASGNTLRDLDMSYLATSLKTKHFGDVLQEMCSVVKFRSLRLNAEIDTKWMEALAKHSADHLEIFELPMVPDEGEGEDDDDDSVKKEKKTKNEIIAKSLIETVIPIGFKNLRILNFIESDFVNDDVLIALSKNCPKLTECAVEFNNVITAKGMLALLTTGVTSKSLESIDAGSCPKLVSDKNFFQELIHRKKRNTNSNDDILLPNLHTFRLAGSDTVPCAIDDECLIGLLECFPFWNSVSLRFSEVTSKGMLTIPKYRVSLSALDIIGCPDINGEHVLTLAKTLPHLGCVNVGDFQTDPYLENLDNTSKNFPEHIREEIEKFCTFIVF